MTTVNGIAKVLFFIKGMTPDADERTKIDELLTHRFAIQIRSNQHKAMFENDTIPEPATFVSGTVPASHAGYPVFVEPGHGELKIGDNVSVTDVATGISFVAPLKMVADNIGVAVPVDKLLVTEGQTKNVKLHVTGTNQKYALSSSLQFHLSNDGHLNEMTVTDNTTCIVGQGEKLYLMLPGNNATLIVTGRDAATGRPKFDFNQVQCAVTDKWPFASAFANSKDSSRQFNVTPTVVNQVIRSLALPNDAYVIADKEEINIGGITYIVRVINGKIGSITPKPQPEA